MRTLIIGALAVTMAGCSSRMSPHANTASDANGVTCSETAARQPLELVPVIYQSRSAIVKIHARTAAKRKPPPSARVPPSSASSKRPSPPAHKAAADSGPAHARISDSHSGGGAVASPRTPTIQQQVEAATAVAERISVAPAGAASSGEPDSRVALVMARPEIKSVSDLGGKTVAVDDRLAASKNKVWIAMVAAGAARVQFSEDQATPVDRLVRGEVPAAVLTLVSAEAAGSFPDIAGYRIFRIPLSLRSIDTRQDKP
jgi:hypothetical protein